MITKRDVKKSRKPKAIFQIANLLIAVVAFSFIISFSSVKVSAVYSVVGIDSAGNYLYKSTTDSNYYVYNPNLPDPDVIAGPAELSKFSALSQGTEVLGPPSPPSSLLPAKVITTPVTPTVHSFYGDAQNVNGVTPLNPSGTTLPKMDLKNVDRVDIFSDHAIVYHNDGQATVRVSVDDGNAIQSQAKFEEISAPEIPILGGTSFAISALLKGIIFAGLVVGAIQLIGNLVGADKTLINALSGAAGGGIFMGMLTTGLIKEAGAGLQPGFLGMTNALGERGIKIRVNNNLKVVKE